MKVRNFQWSDLARLQEIFAGQGIPPECWPEIALQIQKRNKATLIQNPRFPIKKVVEDESGKVAMAALLKITSEPFLVLDHHAENPGWRWQALTELVEALAADAKLRGLEDTTCWVPPNLVPSFGPRLQALGFVESPWQSFTRKL